MREGQVIAMHQANARRNALMFGQWELLNAWQVAFEAVLKASRLRDRIRWAIWPSDFVQAVHAVQVKVINDGRKKAEEAASRKTISVVGANGVKEVAVGG